MALKIRGGKRVCGVRSWFLVLVWFRGGRYGCGMWKSILKIKVIFWKFIRLKARSSKEIRFWEDRWVGEQPLKDSFRNLFSIAFDPLI